MKREDDLPVLAAMTRVLQICFSVGRFRLFAGRRICWPVLPFSTQTWRLRLNQGGRFGWLMISRFAHYLHSWLWRSRWHNISGWKHDHDLIRHFGETSPVWKLQTPQMACFHFAQTKATTLLTPDWMMHAVVECAAKELVAVNLSGDCTVGLLERHLWGVTNDHRGASWKLVVFI